MNDVLGKIVFLCVVFILCSSSVFAISETDEHYDRLVSRAEFKNLDSYTVNLIQENLAVIYQHDLNWSRDVRLSQRPLTDGVVGPVTLFWLQRFITDFKIEPIGNFVSQVNIRLERIASFANMFPEETSILLSADFAHWNDKQLNLQRESYYRIRQSGSDQELLDLVYRYLQVSDPQSNVMGDGSELTIYYYQLDTEDFKILRSKDLITQQLATLENIRYDNVAMLSAAVSDVLGDFPEQIKKILPFIQRYYLQSDPVVTKNFIVALTKQMLGDPRYSALNSTLAVLLEKELADITYPDKNLFDKAAQAKIRAGIGACYPPKQHNQHILSLRLGDEEFEQLSNELLTGMYYQGMPNIRQQLAEIKRLRLKKSADCGASERGMVKSFVADLYNNNVQPAIAVLYKKTPEFDPKNSIQWYGGGCGCVLDELSGTVYGFYPFWLANKTGEQKVNFSVLSRVAYYGLSFDDKGNIQQANNNYKASILSEDGRVKSEMSEFIQVAHRHNSKVDWVIQNDKPYWDSWKSITFGTRAIIFESLEDNIINLLTNPLLSGLTQLKQTLTGGMLSPPTQGNGVSLYFNDYPDDPDSITLFSNFVDNLKNKLKIVDDDYFINIMVPQSAFGEGFYSYENLLGLISNPVENE
ncbi:MAG: hypothetical protein OEY78_10350, partial [Gammaproteobacteria bacterium]|nr:hypothetical protein [Gammaproteobacteria bacterium]